MKTVKANSLNNKDIVSVFEYKEKLHIAAQNNTFGAFRFFTSIECVLLCADDVLLDCSCGLSCLADKNEDIYIFDTKDIIDKAFR